MIINMLLFDVKLNMTKQAYLLLLIFFILLIIVYFIARYLVHSLGYVYNQMFYDKINFRIPIVEVITILIGVFLIAKLLIQYLLVNSYIVFLLLFLLLIIINTAIGCLYAKALIATKRPEEVGFYLRWYYKLSKK